MTIERIFTEKHSCPKRAPTLRLHRLHEAYALAKYLDWIVEEGQSVLHTECKLKNLSLFGVSLATEYVQPLFEGFEEAAAISSRALVLRLPRACEQILPSLVTTPPRIESRHAPGFCGQVPFLVFSIGRGKEENFPAELDELRVCVEATEFFLSEHELERARAPTIFVPTVMIAGNSLACGGYAADKRHILELGRLRKLGKDNQASSSCGYRLASQRGVSQLDHTTQSASHESCPETVNRGRSTFSLEAPLASYWSDPDFWDEESGAPLPNPYWLY